MTATCPIDETVDEINGSAEEDATVRQPLERSEADRAAALAAIRRFRGDESLRLTYLTTTANPYRDDGSLIETYADDDGFEYWINPQRDVLVQMGPAARASAPSHSTRPEDRLPVSELRQLALGVIECQRPDFTARRSSLHPLEDNRRRETYFFRWDDFGTPTGDSELPPFLQVALSSDGRLISFTDTLRD